MMMKTTPWLPGATKPARPGAYERKFDGRPVKQYWDGTRWPGPPGHQHLPWRGVTHAGVTMSMGELVLAVYGDHGAGSLTKWQIERTLRIVAKLVNDYGLVEVACADMTTHVITK